MATMARGHMSVVRTSGLRPRVATTVTTNTAAAPSTQRMLLVMSQQHTGCTQQKQSDPDGLPPLKERHLLHLAGRRQRMGAQARGGAGPRHLVGEPAREVELA